MSSEFKGAVRVVPLKIIGFEVLSGSHDEPRDILRDVSKGIQQIKNHLYFAWRAWHFNEGNDIAITKWVDEYRSWAKADKKERGNKPKCPCHPLPPKCMSSLLKSITTRCPQVHSRCAGLALQRESKDLISHNAVKTAFKRWHHILMDLGEQPNFSRPQPIPFDVQNGTIIKGEEKDQWYMDVRLDRVPRTTKAGTRAYGSTLLRLKLKTRGGRCGGVRTKLNKCYYKTWKFCGSAVVEKEKGWFIQLCYQEDKHEQVELDPKQTAVLKPANGHPWTLRIGGRSFWVMGRGRLVMKIRRQCGEQRATRNESARYAGKARKGHGRKRAVYDVKNMEDNFKKTFNAQTVARVVRIMQDRGVGVLYFRQPKTPRGKYLLTAGASDRRPGLWPWYQVETMFKQACQREGIELKSSGTKAKSVKKGGQKLGIER